MKFVIALSLLAGASFAQATQLSDFIGKYKVVEKDCDFLGDTAYASYVRGKADELIGVRVSIYGQDPTGFEMVLGKTTRDNPNFKYGNPVKTVITNGYWSKGKLLSTLTHVYADGRQELVHSEWLELTKKGMLYTAVDGADSYTCKFIRQ